MRDMALGPSPNELDRLESTLLVRANTLDLGDASIPFMLSAASMLKGKGTTVAPSPSPFLHNVAGVREGDQLCKQHSAVV